MIGKLSELQKEKNEQCTQRHELAVERLRTIVTEETVNTAYISYFQDCTLFLLELENTRKKLSHLLPQFFTGIVLIGIACLIFLSYNITIKNPVQATLFFKT